MPTFIRSNAGNWFRKEIDSDGQPIYYKPASDIPRHGIIENNPIEAESWTDFVKITGINPLKVFIPAATGWIDTNGAFLWASAEDIGRILYDVDGLDSYQLHNLGYIYVSIADNDFLKKVENGYYDNLEPKQSEMFSSWFQKYKYRIMNYD